MKIGKPAQFFPHITPTSTDGTKITVVVDKQKIDSCIVLWENTILDTNLVKRKGKIITINIPEAASKQKKSTIRVYAWNRMAMANDLSIPILQGKVQLQIDRTDFQNMIMYFALVDRFNNGNKTNDAPIKDKDIANAANYQGGDLAGITAKIKDGYFDRLGINTIWVSPIVQNPEIGYVEYPEPHRKYSGYHGYWPISSTKIDHRFGTDAEMKELVKEAHMRGMRVLIDFVSNHIHEEHPIYKNHKDWTTPIDLPDGKKNIRIWDEHRLTTWFDTFLPDLDYTKPQVINAVTDSAVWWIKTYDLDGFRHDATKHVSEVFWRELTRKLKQNIEIPTGKKLYQIGETFGTRELIGSYVNNGEQDAQFDFNTYFDARNTFSDSTTSFKSLAQSVNYSFLYYGSHHLMGNISGNHDLARFISYASGAMSFSDDDRKTAWTKNIKVENPIGYKRLLQLQAFNMTIPGIPIIYYADEYGMPGAGDPDNRRFMQFDGLSINEKNTLETTQKIAAIRKKSLAMNYGETNFLLTTDKEMAIARTYFKDVAITLFNKNNKPKLIEVILPQEYSGTELQSNFGNEIIRQGVRINIMLPPNSFEILTVK
jgi:glycosidase